jgi:DNA-binding NarL/FixJ family response regulator
MGKPQLLLADDHELFVAGMRKLLEDDFDLVGSVGDGRAAVERYRELRPDLILLDISLPLLNGVEAARQIKRFAPDARILFVTMQVDRVYLEEAFAAGGAGYVLKQAAVTDLNNAIRTVLRGKYYVNGDLAAKAGWVFPDFEDTSRHPTDSKLTPRQREVLQLVAEGKSLKEIAQILGISVRTVEFHKNGIMNELGCRTTAELTRYALAHGILVP